jgi:signal transduction histidine kinase
MVSDSRGYASRPDPQSAEVNDLRANERRRIARELHDSTSQLLVDLERDLKWLEEVSGPHVQALVEECWHSINEIGDHIRALGSD